MAGNQTLDDFIGAHPLSEGIPIEPVVIHAAIAMGAKISIEVECSKNPQFTDATVLGQNMLTLFSLKDFCDKEKISMPEPDFKKQSGGFEVKVKIFLDESTIPFSVELPFIHETSQKAGGFTALVCALSDKPINESSIVVEGFRLQKFGIGPLVNVEAIQPSKALDQANLSYDPFSRAVVSPFPRVQMSPVPFLNAVRSTPTQVQQIPEQHDEEEGAAEEGAAEAGSADQEQPFIPVVSKKKIREFFGASEAPPKSLPVGAVYNQRPKGKIASWSTFKEGGLARGRELTDIFTDWINFVLQHHDQYKTGNREGYGVYLKTQLGEDYATLQQFLPK
jgi:hypothetical protein